MGDLPIRNIALHGSASARAGVLGGVESGDRLAAVCGPSGGLDGTADVVEAARKIGLPVDVFCLHGPRGTERDWHHWAMHDIRRFTPSAMVPVGSRLWVAESGGTAWALLRGDPPSIGALVDVGMAIAPGGPGPSASLAALAEGLIVARQGGGGSRCVGKLLWASVDEGVLALSFDGSVQRLVGLGAPAAPLAASGDGIWAVLAWSGTLVRLGPDGTEAGRIDVGSQIVALAAGSEGAWVVTADDILGGRRPYRGGCRPGRPGAACSPAPLRAARRAFERAPAGGGYDQGTAIGDGKQAAPGGRSLPWATADHPAAGAISGRCPPKSSPRVQRPFWTWPETCMQK
jgi:hypothetical protein